MCLTIKHKTLISGSWGQWDMSLKQHQVSVSTFVLASLSSLLSLVSWGDAVWALILELLYMVFCKMLLKLKSQHLETSKSCVYINIYTDKTASFLLLLHPWPSPCHFLLWHRCRLWYPAHFCRGHQCLPRNLAVRRSNINTFSLIEGINTLRTHAYWHVMCMYIIYIYMLFYVVTYVKYGTSYNLYSPSYIPSHGGSNLSLMVQVTRPKTHVQTIGFPDSINSETQKTPKKWTNQNYSCKSWMIYC